MCRVDVCVFCCVLCVPLFRSVLLLGVVYSCCECFDFVLFMASVSFHSVSNSSLDVFDVFH